MVGADQLFQRRIAAREQHHHLHLLHRHARQCLAQALQAHKLEALGEGEILLHQPVASKAGGSDGQQGLVVLEAHGGYGAAGEHFLRTCQGAGGAQRPQQHTNGFTQQAFIQLPGHVLRAAQVNGQLVERDLVEAESRRGLQGEAQTTPHIARLGQLVQGQVGGVTEILCPCDLQGPQPQGVCRAKFAIGPLPRSLPCPQRAAAWHGGAGGQVGVAQFRLAAGHHHGGGGRQVVGVHHVQQVAGEAGVFGIQLQAHAGRQEGRGFDEPLDIGVGDLVPLHTQAVGDLGESLGELPRAVAEVAQFLLVKAQESRVHGVSWRRLNG